MTLLCFNLMTLLCLNLQMSYAEAKYEKHSFTVTDEEGKTCKANYPFADYSLIDNAVLRNGKRWNQCLAGCKSGWKQMSYCNEKGKLGGYPQVEFYTKSGKLHAIYWPDVNTLVSTVKAKRNESLKNWKYLDKAELVSKHMTRKDCINSWWKANGEIWQKPTIWGGKNKFQIMRESDKVKEQKRQEERNKRLAYERKTKTFRKNLEAGSIASNGMVIEIKGKLVKIQEEKSQCTQRDYDGNCKNWVTAPIEKWIKMSEIYPPQ